jgi:hypothetical protein
MTAIVNTEYGLPHVLQRQDGGKPALQDTETAPAFVELEASVQDVKGSMAGPVAQELAARGIGVRSGCHCAHLLIKHVLHIPSLLEQFQGLLLTVLPKLSLPGVVRVSLGIENSAEDVDKLLQVLSEIARAPKARADVKAQMDEFARAAAQRVYSPL